MVDWDDVLAYNTVKIVRVRHKWVGLFHKLSLLVIFIYIVLYEIILQEGYYLRETPHGAVQLSLMPPDSRLTIPVLPYCDQTQEARPYSPTSLRCVNWGEDLTGIQKGQDLLVVTRVGISDITRNCNETTPIGTVLEDDGNGNTVLCEENQSDEFMYYVSDIEDFKIMVVHAVRATSTGYSGGTFKHARPSAASLSPDAVPVEIQLKYADVTERQADLTEEERTEGVKGAVDVHPDGDFISVRNLLKAAHLDLDDISTQTTDREPNRYAGLNIMVKIIFNNNGAAEYAYQPEVLPAEAKLVGEFGINYPYERRVHNQHGVRFKFVISGEIKMFDFKTLLLSFVSGLALTSLAALFVDTLITYVMPQKATTSCSNTISHPTSRRRTLTNRPCSTRFSPKSAGSATSWRA
eukprot:JP446185.1.p1 GENE.JP446185.1~~JP446185.1.p1  ORF type:complete len:408 (+),score=87.64 JP446185.1:30-1253(+)